MKQITGLICLASFCAGAVWAEYEMTSRFGSGLVLLAGASALAAVLAALYRAPEGREDTNGFHILPRSRRPRLYRRLQLLQRQVRREWV